MNDKTWTFLQKNDNTYVIVVVIVQITVIFYPCIA